MHNDPTPIYGTGKQSRDFTYVANVAEANLLAAEKTGLKCGLFNVACGKDHSVLELAKILNKILNKQVKPLYLPKRPGDVFRTLADLSQIKKTLGYDPKTDFIQGLKLTVEYFQEKS
jgi:UDP-glucose 4-epimerase